MHSPADDYDLSRGIIALPWPYALAYNAAILAFLAAAFAAQTTGFVAGVFTGQALNTLFCAVCTERARHGR